MNGKLFWLALIVVVLSALSTASAYDTNEYDVNGDVLTVHDVEFTMPDGYRIWDSLTGVDDVEKTSTCVLTNDSSKGLILISVWFDKKYDKLEEVVGENTTVNGVNGIICKMKTGNVDQSVFGYLVDGKQVNVMVNTGHEDLLSKVVKKQA